MTDLAEDAEIDTSVYDENEKQENIERWITFCLGEEAYGIDVIQVREILRAFNVLPVPGAPAHIMGITNIRGSVVTVIDGRKRFNLPSKEDDDDTRLIVLEYKDEVAGVIVDSVSDVLDLPDSAIDTNPRLNITEGSKYIKGIVNHTNGLIIILSVEKFFTND